MTQSIQTWLRRSTRPFRWARWVGRAAMLVAAMSLILGAADEPALQQQPAPAKAKPDTEGPRGGEATAGDAATDVAYLLPLPLPITGTIDTQIKRQIDQFVSNTKQRDHRPLLVIEFRGGDSRGAGSEFERCLSLARYLASDRLTGVRTIAYLPQGAEGHAVLPALACEELIMPADARFGHAGIGEQFLDPTMKRGYSEIADRRRTVPAAVALGMLDPALAIHKVQTLDGVQFATDEELPALRDAGKVTAVEAVTRAGEPAVFTGEELRVKYGFVSRLAGSLPELASALNLPADSIRQDPSLGGQWRGVRLDISGPINRQQINWVLRGLRDRLGERPPYRANLVLFVIDSPGGSLEDSLRLAAQISQWDAAAVRTVAFVDHEALGDAALIALACDQLVATPEAVLGGPGAQAFSAEQLADARRAIQEFRQNKGRNWSLPVALLEPDLPVHRYTNERFPGGDRWLCRDELLEQDDPAAWQQGDAVDTRQGVTGGVAAELGLAAANVVDFQEFRRLQHLDDELPVLRPNWAHLFIERLAAPQFAALLLFVAFLAGMIEMSQPGIGVPGFVAVTCLVLFFWSNVLHGTAGWLEVLLFVTGAAFLAVELFLLPGFGVFGIGGALMMIAAVVLASQTFLIPRNAYQLQRLPSSLMMVVAGMAGCFAALAVIRQFLPHTPFLNQLMLEEPDEETRLERERREVVADFGHLAGKTGTALTPLIPSGRVRFGDEVVDVVSDGELVPRGEAVVVKEVMGNRVVVIRAREAS